MSIVALTINRHATKSNQLKQLIRNARRASLQRTFKKSFTSFSHSTRNKTRDGLIRVRNIRSLNGFFFSSRRRHTSSLCDWSSDVCSSDLFGELGPYTVGLNTQNLLAILSIIVL